MDVTLADRLRRLGDLFQRLRGRFRGWRQTRPFWAGLFTILGGLEIMLLPMGPLPVVFRMGIGALGGILIGACLMLAGGFLWRAPDRQMRQFLALFIGLFAVASFVISNFGGFLIGMLLGILGAAMAYGWRPLPEPAAADDEPEPFEAPRGGPAAAYTPAERPGIPMAVLLVALALAGGYAVTSAPAEAVGVPAAGPSASPSTGWSPVPSGSPSPSATPSAQPKAAVDEGVRPGAHPLRIDAAKLGASRFVYRGVGTLRGPDGPVKALHLTIRSLDFDDFRLGSTDPDAPKLLMRAADIRFQGLDLWVTSLKVDLRFPLPIKGLTITPDKVPFWLIPNVPVPLRADHGEITLSYGTIDQIQIDRPLGITLS